MTVIDAARQYGGIAISVLVCAALAKLICELAQLLHLGRSSHTPLKRSAMLMVGPLRRWTIARFLLGGIGIACMATLSAMLKNATNGDVNATSLTVAVIAGFASLLAGELCERHLFFTASVAPRMPGGIV
jgi:uncharacterized paraquat-inducible protein A